MNLSRVVGSVSRKIGKMRLKNYNVKLNLSRDALFDELGIKRLRESYMRDDEVSPQERFAYVSKAFGSNPEHAQRLYDYASRHWLSYSTPILSYGKTKKGMPISCYLTYIDDTTLGLLDNQYETNYLSTLGGGVGIGFGIRSIDDKSVGVIPHLKTYDVSSLAYKQSSRRGSYAAYLDICHPEIVQFIEIRKPTGDPNMRCQNLHHGINVSDKFMEIIERCMVDPDANDDWELIDPHDKKVREVVSAKWLWQQIMELRMHTGEPYLHFIDTANRGLPEFMKKLGHTIKQSNLCLTGDTLISIKVDGYIEEVRLDNFTEGFSLGMYTDVEVKTLKDGVEVYSRVTDAGETGLASELIEIETPSGKVIRCTLNHLIPTINRGFVKASDLVETDELVEI
jgi:ribonucleoside-diphosphate reductase alpha chain